jgi:protein O-mannosyl-transferase
VNVNWSRAGDLSKYIISSLVTHITRSHVIIINAPDNLNGAYVFRNGLFPALRLFMNTYIVSLDISVHHNVRSIDEVIESSHQQTNPLHFSLFIPQTLWYQINKHIRNVEASKTQSELFEFIFNDKVVQEYDVFMYTSGTMKRVFLKATSAEIEKNESEK